MANSIPTPADLRKMFSYDPANGRLFRVDGSEAFTSKTERGYARQRVNGHKLFAHRVIWAMIYDEWPDQIDHINGVKHDNRLSNLRNVDCQTNNRNKPNKRPGGITGMHWRADKKKWRPMITIDGKGNFLGYFHCFGQALRARKAAEREAGFHPNHGRHW